MKSVQNKFLIYCSYTDMFTIVINSVCSKKPAGMELMLWVDPSTRLKSIQVIIHCLLHWYCRTLYDITCTVEPPNNGYFGSTTFVLYREVVLFQRFFCIAKTTSVPICLSFIRRLSSSRSVHYRRFHCTCIWHSIINNDYYSFNLITEFKWSGNGWLSRNDRKQWWYGLMISLLVFTIIFCLSLKLLQSLMITVI